MMKKVTLKHKIIIIKFRQFLEQTTLPHNKSNHLPGNLLPNNLNPSLILHLPKLALHAHLNLNHPARKLQNPNTLANEQNLSGSFELD